MKFLIALVAVCLVQGALAQRTRQGQCAKVTGQSDFDLTQFVGTWFGFTKFGTEPVFGTDCNTAEFTSTGSSSFDVKITTGRNSKKTTATYSAKITAPGQFDITVGKDVQSYSILGTNYLDWASLYLCKNVNSTHLYENMYVYSRERGFLYQKYLTPAEQTFIDYDIPVKRPTYTEQQNCPRN